jgi:DNA-binding GntR family transcriptional regulator
VRHDDGSDRVVIADSVTEELRSDILEGVFMPGERLIELQLSERYDCGRAAVREALVQLESEGLVERQANRGAIVRRVSIAEAIEITEARSALESLITARATRRATDDDKTELKQIIADMRDAVGSDDAVGYSNLNLRLHHKLRTMSQHRVANEMVENLRNRAVQNQYRLSLMPGRQAVSLEQHAAIVDAVVSGDEAAAATAMTAHLSSVIDVLSQWGDAR